MCVMYSVLCVDVASPQCFMTARPIYKQPRQFARNSTGRKVPLLSANEDEFVVKRRRLLQLDQLINNQDTARQQIKEQKTQIVRFVFDGGDELWSSS